MDSQHRHELQDNVLAHWLERQIEANKPRLPMIFGAVLAVGVAVWGFGWLRSSSESSRYAAWDGYAIAMERGQPNLALLERVVGDQAGTAAADWAGVTFADGKLYVAAQSYLANRTTAETSLEEAKEQYQQLRGSSDARVRSRAVFGLARVAELEGDLEGAAKLYGQVTGAFAKLAAERAEELATDRAKDDYAWLATAAPAVRRAPSSDDLSGLIPDFTADAIETPTGDTPAATDTPEADLPSGEESIDDILKDIQAEEAAEADTADSDSEAAETAGAGSDAAPADGE